MRGFSDGGDERGGILVETCMLESDFALGIQERDHVRVRKLPARVLRVIYAEQRSEFTHVVRLAVQQRPALDGEVAFGTKGCEFGGGVAARINTDEQEIHFAKH